MNTKNVQLSYMTSKLLKYVTILDKNYEQSLCKSAIMSINRKVMILRGNSESKRSSIALFWSGNWQRCHRIYRNHHSERHFCSMFPDCKEMETLFLLKRQFRIILPNELTLSFLVKLPWDYQFSFNGFTEC